MGENRNESGACGNAATLFVAQPPATDREIFPSLSIKFTSKSLYFSLSKEKFARGCDLAKEILAQRFWNQLPSGRGPNIVSRIASKQQDPCSLHCSLFASHRVSPPMGPRFTPGKRGRKRTRCSRTGRFP